MSLPTLCLLAALPVCTAFAHNGRFTTGAQRRVVHSPSMLENEISTAALNLVSTTNSMDAQLGALRTLIDMDKVKTEIAEERYAALKAELEQMQAKVASLSSELVSQAPMAEEPKAAIAAATPTEEELRSILVDSIQTIETPVAVPSAPVEQAAIETLGQATMQSPGIGGRVSEEALAIFAQPAAPDATPVIETLSQAAVPSPVTEAILDPGAAQVAIKAAGEAIIASQGRVTPDATPVVLAAATLIIIYQWSETIKAVPKLGGEPAGSKIPSFVSVAADATKQSTAADGQRNAWEIVSAGLVNLKAADFEGWFNGAPSALYSNAPVATGVAVAAPFEWTPAPVAKSAQETAAATLPGGSAARFEKAAPPMGAKEVAKAAARASAAVNAASAALAAGKPISAAEAAEAAAELDAIMDIMTPDSKEQLKGVVTPTVTEDVKSGAK